jgi:hypothetical protein
VSRIVLAFASGRLVAARPFYYRRKVMMLGQVLACVQETPTFHKSALPKLAAEVAKITSEEAEALAENLDIVYSCGYLTSGPNKWLKVDRVDAVLLLLVAPLNLPDWLNDLQIDERWSAWRYRGGKSLAEYKEINCKILDRKLVRYFKSVRETLFD